MRENICMKKKIISRLFFLVPFLALTACTVYQNEIGSSYSTLIVNDIDMPDEESKAKFQELLDTLDELEDVQNVFHNVNL